VWLKIIVIPPLDRGTRELLPFTGRSKSFEVLVGTPVEGDERSSNDSPKVQERFLVDLIFPEQFGVIGKVPKKPIELPKCSLAAVQPPREGMGCERLGLKDYKAKNQEGLLRMPAIGSCIDTHQEQALERTSRRLLP
jgi:hypothetical protein